MSAVVERITRHWSGPVRAERTASWPGRVAQWWRRGFSPPPRKAFSVTINDDGFIPLDPGIGDTRLPRTLYPYGRDLQDGLNSNSVLSPIGWIARNFTEADLEVQRRVNGTKWEAMPDHPLSDLLDAPNDFYGGDELWKATVLSYCLDGNGYWLKVRNSFGEVIQIWYVPHFLIEPRFPWDGSAYITHYDYFPEFGIPLRLPPRDVVHFRLGLDPRNTRKGMSPLKSLLREVFTDEEAANFSATILRNMGVPGGVISPADAKALPNQADIEEMKRFMKEGFTGDRRGEWLPLGVPTKIEQFGFDPNNLMVAPLRDITEERVCAMFGVPAAVVGFGAGLQQTKVGATMKELVHLAWNSCLTPMQTTMGRQASRQLVPEFQSQTRRFRIRFNRDQVAAFREEDSQVVDRVTKLVGAGIQRVDSAQETVGLDPDQSQAVYLRPTNVTVVREGDAAVAEPTPPEPNDGGTDDDDPDVPTMQNRIARLLAAQNGRR